MKLEMKQRMEQTDFKKLVSEFRLRLRNIGLDAEFMEIPLPRVRELADAIDALLAENRAENEAHALFVIDTSEQIAALRAKLAKATEALIYYSEICDCPQKAIREPHDELCHLQKARAALAAIKETTNAR